jgi:hypothetical protein
MVGFFQVWHERRVNGAGVELLIKVLIIIIDVLKQWQCSDGLAMWW